MQPKKRKLGVSVKLLLACAILAFLCMVGSVAVLKLEPPPSWASDAERTFMVGCWMFLVLGVLLKGAVALFDKPE